MPVYKINMKGRAAAVLVKAETAAKAKDAVLTVESITAEEMVDAIANGESIWTPGTDFPADVAPEKIDEDWF